MRAFKIFTAAALAVSLVFLTGCWDYREVEDMYIVGGIAIDKGTQGHRYRVTAEVLDLSSGGGEKQSPIKGKVLESEGETVSEAIAALSRRANKSLYYGDCKMVIFSRDIAAEGLSGVLDWMNRDPQPRFTIQAYVSQEQTAGEILLKGSPNGQPITLLISKTMEKTASYSGKSQAVELYQLDNSLWGEGLSPTLPDIRFRRYEDGVEPELYGTAVFQGDRYIGELDDQESFYFLFITDNNSGGIFLTGEKPDDKDISLKIRKSSTDVEPVLSGNNIRMKIKIRMEASYDEECSQKNLLKNQGIKAIEQYAEKSLVKRVGQTVDTVQKKYGSDIFGFGRKIYEKDPSLWEKIKPEWNRYFRNLKCDISAEVVITDTGFAFPKGYE
ncbi:MAG: Ger(x)C family spore germination protein [Oscillospiraceae bacterium]|jgi:spore germination protein KC|nr:Ger(x)C family spore germination protein [Oscillospiraceae bacterium]